MLSVLTSQLFALQQHQVSAQIRRWYSSLAPTTLDCLQACLELCTYKNQMGLLKISALGLSARLQVRSQAHARQQIFKTIAHRTSFLQMLTSLAINLTRRTLPLQSQTRVKRFLQVRASILKAIVMPMQLSTMLYLAHTLCPHQVQISNSVLALLLRADILAG